MQQQTSVIGWRFWLVRPGQDLLLSPYDYGPPWPTLTLAATCSASPEHCPPAPGCDCGVYAERTAADARERVRRHRRAVRINLGLAGVRPPPLPSYAIGRVALTGAVPFVPRPGSVRVGADELRAASAEIVELWVQPSANDPHVGGRLATRYGVPASIDELARARR
ncbi:tyrosine phosphatase domain protein [Mycobacterium intracellulare MIN_061107_1834]|nr:tyrosine phosphatase domain protein [Mycobacterium intracellulare MIN_061107_1834]